MTGYHSTVNNTNLQNAEHVDVVFVCISNFAVKAANAPQLMHIALDRELELQINMHMLCIMQLVFIESMQPTISRACASV